MKNLLIILTAFTIGGCILVEPEPYYHDDPYAYEYYYEEPGVVVVETYTVSPGPSVIVVEEEWCTYEDVPYYNDPLYCDDWGYCTWTEWYGQWYCYITYSWDEFCGWEFYSEECI